MMSVKDVLGYIFIPLAVVVLVVFTLEKKLPEFKNISKRKIINIVAICCGMAVMIPMAIFRPLTSDEEKQKLRAASRKRLLRLAEISTKDDCLNAKDIAYDVRERVASELRVNPALVTLGRMSYENKCVAVLYVPTGMYVCGITTTVTKGIVSECKERY